MCSESKASVLTASGFLRCPPCVYSVFVACVVALFWPGLVDSQVPVFRDAFHFYYPQAVWLDQCAQRGELFPLWQPNEGFGTSVPGETTSALFYPLRVLWFLPLLTIAQRYAVVVIVHLIIAASGMLYACARWKLRPEAGWLAGAAYALSCPVLFQHHNLVFLCSAAWLGFVLSEIGLWLAPPDDFQKSTTDQFRYSVTRSILVMSAALAMMMLAGDPHTVVNCLLLCLSSLTVVAIARRSVYLGRTVLLRLAMATVIAAGLSSVQWIPTLQWSASSHRWQSDLLSREHADVNSSRPFELLGPLDLEHYQHRETRYDFSLPPWHLLTNIWPTLGGRFSPLNARAYAYLPAEGRMWQPSLFFGLLPFLLLCRGVIVKRYRSHRWLLFATAFALLAAFGNYSLGWVLRELFRLNGIESLAKNYPADHYSSLYGILTECIPGYALFRYPAKWSVLYVGCGALFAAVHLHQLEASELRRFSSGRRVIAILSALGLAITVTCLLLGARNSTFYDQLANYLPTPVIDAWLGRPILPQVCMQISVACILPISLLAAIALVQVQAKTVDKQSLREPLPIHHIFAWLTLIETFVAANCWCSFINPPAASQPAQLPNAALVWADASEANIEHDKWLDDRAPASVIADYQMQWLLGKLGLMEGRRNLGATLSIEPEMLQHIKRVLALRDNLTEVQPGLDSALAWLGVEERLVRQRHEDQRATFTWHPVPLPRPLCEVFTDKPNSTFPTAGILTTGEAVPEVAQWKWLSSSQLQIDLERTGSATLLIRQFNDGGWIAKSATGPLDVGSSMGGLFITIDAPVGSKTIILQRATWPVISGAIISLLTLAACAWHLRPVRDQSS